MQVKKQQLEPNMEQLIDVKLGKEYVKAVYCHFYYLISINTDDAEYIIWNSSWMNHRLESRLLGETFITSDMWMIPL